VAGEGQSRTRVGLLAVCLGTANDTDLSCPLSSAIR
ncbi:uncharacterized protein METZ01_LOCUS176035, partial [marine metagenome]